MKIVLVHGVSHCEATSNYYAPWKQAIASGLQASGFQGTPDFVEFTYDALFEKHYSGPGVYVSALAELAATTAEHEILDPIRDYIHNLFHPSRELVWGGDAIRWSAGMVAQFAVEDGLRSDLRDNFFSVLEAEEPDLVAAHSLGSLLTFDFLCNDPRAEKGASFAYLTFGSQINNVFVRSRVWPGRITMPNVSSWTHLYNDQDPVFTADISIPDARNFASIATSSPAGHSPVRVPEGPGYLDHPNTLQLVWPVLAQLGQPAARALVRSLTAARPLTPAIAARRGLVKPHRRALLIGINDYPDPANRLDGCVNDAFLISSALQERGFAAEDIRVVLDERATAAGIRERLTWLLEDVGDGMERVLFYSGHGAQLPGYNSSEKVDHVDECLVPYDFAWTKETAITDDDFYRLYSDLPFSARFFAMLDCCHAGGMTRDGGRKVRGLTPPDDIRHRLLRWNAKEQMWQERELPTLNPNYGGKEKERHEQTGQNGATFRFGRGTKLNRFISKVGAKKLVKQKRGLFVPVVLEACGENQLSFEYRHGTISYGAFSYSFVKNLRATPTSSFNQLIAQTAKSLLTLGYDQTPQLVGPSSELATPVSKA
jgi:hypothetical protein